MGIFEFNFWTHLLKLFLLKLISKIQCKNKNCIRTFFWETFFKIWQRFSAPMKNKNFCRTKKICSIECKKCWLNFLPLNFDQTPSKYHLASGNKYVFISARALGKPNLPPNHGINLVNAVTILPVVVPNRRRAENCESRRPNL